ncbi:MAG: magnesium transporter CorA family protein [Planctomycetia bacterium]|nr:magnesium transporter CorA family protein [Planctomycetia bacterium]
MISAYIFENGKLVETEDCSEAPVLICTEPDQKEKAFIRDEFDLGHHTLQSVLDENELPRVESRDNKIVIILKHPLHIGVVDTHIEFRVTSLGAVIYEDRLLFIFNEPMPHKEFLMPVARGEDIRDLLINVLHRTTLHFHEHLRCISLGMEQIEEEVIEAEDTKRLIDLFSLGKSLTYYVNALNGNNSLIERIYNSTERLGFNSMQKDTLDDIRLDSAQCCQEAAITTSIMTKMTDTRISMMGNNLNNLMKRLTVISLLIMPMNLIAGIGGMSEYTAFTQGWLPMWASYGLLFLVFVLIAFLTYKVMKKFGLLNY